MLAPVITPCGWFTGWRVCACTCHHSVWMVYRVACLCLHLSSLRVDGLQGGVSVLASVITQCGWFTGWLIVLASVITQCGWFTGWRVCACTCHHSVWMVYRVANCLFLHLSSPSADGLQGGLSVLAPVITPCGWFTGWLIVCSCICHHPVRMVYRVACLCLHLSSLRVDGLQGG